MKQDVPPRPALWRGALSRIAARARHVARRVDAFRNHRWAKPLVAIVLLGLIIGLGITWSLVHSPKLPRKELAQVAESLELLDAQEYEAARRLALQLRSANLTFEELGGPTYVLGAVLFHQAAHHSDPDERRTMYLVASRYLEESRDRGFPKGREAQGTIWLAEAMLAGNRTAESIPMLREALKLNPGQSRRLHRLLAEALLADVPPQLDEARQQIDRYLADDQLTPLQRIDGLWIRAEIAFRAGDHTACRDTLRTLVDQAGHLLPADSEAPTESAHKSGPEAEVPFRPSKRETEHLKRRLSAAISLDGRLLLQQAQRVAEDESLSEAQRIADSNSMLHAVRDTLQQAETDGLITPQSDLVLGLALLQLGQREEALAQMQETSQRHEGTDEGEAAAIEEASLLHQSGRPDEGVAAFLRVLAHVEPRSQYHNPWVTPEEFQRRLMQCFDEALRSARFHQAIQLADAAARFVAEDAAVLMRGDAQEKWARYLMRQAESQPYSVARQQRQQAREQYRAAGATFEQLAQLRYATRLYLADLWRAAENYFAGEDYRRTERTIERYLDEEPRKLRPRALNLLGATRLAAGRIEEALEPLEHCIAAYANDPDSYAARVTAAHVLLEAGRSAEAKKLLLDNLQQEGLTPRSVDWRDSLMLLGEVLHSEGLVTITKSRQLGWDSMDEQKRRQAATQLAAASELFSQAVDRLSEASRRYPDDPRATRIRYLLADAHRHLAQQPRVSLLTESIESRRIDLARQMHAHLEQAYQEFDALARELADKSDATEMTPVEASILRNCYFMRAHALFDLQRYEAAITAYSDATNRYQREPASLEAYQQIAACYRQLNDPVKARGALEQARVVLGTLPLDADYTRTTRFDRATWLSLLQ